MCRTMLCTHTSYTLSYTSTIVHAHKHTYIRTHTHTRHPYASCSDRGGRGGMPRRGARWVFRRPRIHVCVCIQCICICICTCASVCICTCTCASVCICAHAWWCARSHHWVLLASWSNLVHTSTTWSNRANSRVNRPLGTQLTNMYATASIFKIQIKNWRQCIQVIGSYTTPEWADWNQVTSMRWWRWCCYWQPRWQWSRYWQQCLRNRTSH